MKSYFSAINTATELCNMPDPRLRPTEFIAWAEGICELIADIYGRDYDHVYEDLRDHLGITI